MNLTLRKYDFIMGNPETSSVPLEQLSTGEGLGVLGVGETQPFTRTELPPPWPACAPVVRCGGTRLHKGRLDASRAASSRVGANGIKNYRVARRCWLSKLLSVEFRSCETRRVRIIAPQFGLSMADILPGREVCVPA